MPVEVDPAGQTVTVVRAVERDLHSPAAGAGIAISVAVDGGFYL